MQDLDWLLKEIVEIFYYLKMTFIPKFFEIMVYFTIYLVDEFKLDSPVHYRWIFLIEQDLYQLKSSFFLL